MPRCKVQKSLIGNAQSRARTFAQRKKGLRNKAHELSELCGVDVAVVCAGGGGGAPEVWESGAGVLDRYRALPAGTRAKHTHLNYLQVELGKEQAKLAAARQRGPPALDHEGWHKALEEMSLEELLASIDAALLATAERRKALGVPAYDDGGQLWQGAPDAAAAVPLSQQSPSAGELDLGDMESWVEELMWDGAQPMQLSASMTEPEPGVQYSSNDGSVAMGGDQFQPQMASNGAENEHGQLAWEWDTYQMQSTVLYPDHGSQCTSDGDYYDVDTNGCLQNTISYPHYGFQQCADSSNYGASMDGTSQMLVPGNANAYSAWLDMATFCADESSCAAVVPVGDPSSMYISGDPWNAPTEHFTMDVGDSFTGAPAIGFDGGFMDATGDEYGAAQCSADYYFQCPDASQHCGFEPLHYFSDVGEGIHL